jgi:hypothetical protein
LSHRIYAPTAQTQDPLQAKRLLEKDLKFVNAALQEKGIISTNVGRSDAQVEQALTWDLIEQCQGTWNIPKPAVCMCNAVRCRARLLQASYLIRRL